LSPTPSKTVTPPKASRFNEALDTLKGEHFDKFNEIDNGLKVLTKDNLAQGIDISILKLPQSILDQPQSRELISRMKRLLPVVATSKALNMTIAALDPHRVAPICCAVLFATIEVSHHAFLKLSPADSNSWL
jgi:hypothetical protein